MSEETLNNTAEVNATDQDSEVNELALLKQRANLMGIKYSNNIGIEALREKIKTHLEEPKSALDVVPELNDPALPTHTPEGRKLTDRERQLQECMKLVRVRITNLDPKKKELPGEIFTVGNEIIGTVTKFIPYGEVTDDGYHIPNILYENLKERKFLDLRSTKDKKTGKIRVEQRWATEFAFDILPQLKPQELERLRIAQLQAGDN